jgi:hypothetical protein
MHNLQMAEKRRRTDVIDFDEFDAALMQAILENDSDTVIDLLSRLPESSELNGSKLMATLRGENYFQLCALTRPFKLAVNQFFSTLDIFKLRELYESSPLPPVIKEAVLPHHVLKAIYLREAAAIYAAFFSGTGIQAGTADKLARGRYLTGNGHRGLRPIRVRIISFGVHVELFRFLRSLSLR